MTGAAKLPATNTCPVAPGAGADVGTVAAWVAATIARDALADASAWGLVLAASIQHGHDAAKLGARVRRLSGRIGVRAPGTYSRGTRGLGGLSAARPASTADIYEGK